MESTYQLHVVVAIGLILLLGFSVSEVSQAVADTATSSTHDAPGIVAERLSAALVTIPPLSDRSRIRRNLAQATFCLPQNILGTLLHASLQLFGAVVDVGYFNEMTLVITSCPIGVSLGKTIVLPEPFLTERYVRHEYGHTLQGYRHGPFYLLLEGLTSFVQAGFSLISPSFAANYYQRWPENEANELGGNTRSFP